MSHLTEHLRSRDTKATFQGHLEGKENMKQTVQRVF